MIRRKLLIATAIIASVVLTACSDMTGPKNDAACPILNGSSTCLASH
jgi:predicted small secreted protein